MSSESIAWFEFLLNPSLLEQHLHQPEPDPSPVTLIIQFIYNGMKRNDVPVEVETVDPVTQEITDKKKHYLTVLPLQVAAHLNWDLNLFQQQLPLHIQDSLLVALLHETLVEYCNPASHSTLDTGPLLPHQLFSVAMYHRYALSSLVTAKLPSKPPKVPNVPIPGQQDPMQESREVQDGIISALERGAENSVRILEQLLTSGEVRSPVLQSFSLSPKSVNGESSDHVWHKCKLVPDEQFKYQIHYDLGCYHFLHERFSEALHHFTEASKLVSEISASPDYCLIDEKKLKGFYSSCSAICGRSTPVAKRTLYDRYLHSLANNYAGLLDILIEDNVMNEIPFYLRQSLELELVTKQEKTPEDIVFNVQTLNAVGDVLQGRTWDSSYIFTLLQAGKQGAQYLVQLLSSKVAHYSQIQRGQIRTFMETLAVNDGLREILVPQLMACAPLASLFSHEEIVALWPGSEEKISKVNKRAFDTSLGADYSDINDIIWDLIHSYDIALLEKAFKCYLSAQLPRANMVKKDVLDLNSKWDNHIPIPVRNTLMNLLTDPQRGLVFLYIAKSQELTMAKNFQLAVELLNEATNLVRNLKRDSSRPCKMLSWIILIAKIQQQIHELPCVHENEIRNLTVDSKQCLSSWTSNRDVVVPWTSVVNWCVLMLLNAQDWGSLLGTLAPPTGHFPIMHVLKPLAAAAHALHEKHTSKKPWNDIFEIICEILVDNGQQKRNSSGQVVDRYREVIISRASLLDLLESVKEPFCLSVLVSLLGHCFNLLTHDSTSALHIDHLAMWPSSLPSTFEYLESSVVQDMLGWVLEHATKLYPFASHPILPLCSAWYLTKADLAYNKKEYHKAIQNYLTAIFLATDYLRNDTNNPEQNCIHETVIIRMIRSCMSLHSYTQAAVLCQFQETIDYNIAIRCLGERNTIDAMDAYYDCLFDVTLMEFIINLHQKRGETHRRDKVMNVIGLLEINSNNNEEIQREAAKVRKHRFLRAMGKQYL